jgi:hypothetical protein
VKPAKGARRKQAHDENPKTQGNDVVRGIQVEVTHATDQNITDDEVENSPQDVDGRGGKTLTVGFGKRSLKGAAHHAADKMRECVGEKRSSEEVGDVVRPLHRQGLPFLRAVRVRFAITIPQGA